MNQTQFNLNQDDNPHYTQDEQIYDYNMVMYDQLPYQRDSDICDYKRYRSLNLRVVRFYQYDDEHHRVI